MPDDAALAASALAEGTATALMVDYAIRYMDIRDVLALASQSESESLPPFLEKLLLFPYLEGEKFVNDFRGERKSWKPIDAIYRFRRPRSAEQILHPRGTRWASGQSVCSRRRSRRRSGLDGGGCARRRWGSTTCGCCSTS